ncbi:MAG: hypothetical protein C0448_05610 [Sphingobacteriaceae bacterium]|nr:hypothetical protein [Sphingobacteriaceae bacterium]
MILYLTFNDAPSGIFSSQVIDVVKFLNIHVQEKVQLVSFVSIRNYFNHKAKIKAELSDAIVLPMFPGVHRWRLNSFLLFLIVLFKSPKKIIGRSVLATQLALKMRSSGRVNEVIYDGRGAIKAEWEEYQVIQNPKMLSEIFNLEKKVVLKSDGRIAVSNKLITYWKHDFGYCSNDHVVIPCTLNKLFEDVVLTEQTINEARKAIGFDENAIVFVYSGSVAGWQSFNVLYDYISPILNRDSNYKLMFLSDEDENILKLQHQFPHQVICKKLKVNDVPKYLLAADYGLLLREETVTNQVASPVKFAEYIACGLKVIISDHLGDYSKFVETFDNGILNGKHVLPHKKVLFSDKQKIKYIAQTNFSKIHFLSQYKNLILDNKY